MQLKEIKFEFLNIFFIIQFTLYGKVEKIIYF